MANDEGEWTTVGGSKGKNQNGNAKTRQPSPQKQEKQDEIRAAGLESSKITRMNSHTRGSQPTGSSTPPTKRKPAKVLSKADTLQAIEKMDLTTLAETIDAFERKYPKKMPLQLRCLVDALDETLEAILPVTFARLARLGAAFIDAPMSQLDSEVKKALEAALQQGHVEAKFLAKLEDCSGNDLSKIYQTLAMRIIDYQKKGVTSTGFASQLCLQWMSRRFPEVAISAYPRLFQEYGNYESMPAVGHTLTWLVSQTTAHDPSEAMMVWNRFYKRSLLQRDISAAMSFQSLAIDFIEHTIPIMVKSKYAKGSPSFLAQVLDGLLVLSYSTETGMAHSKKSGELIPRVQRLYETFEKLCMMPRSNAKWLTAIFEEILYLDCHPEQPVRLHAIRILLWCLHHQPEAVYKRWLSIYDVNVKSSKPLLDYHMRHLNEVKKTNVFRPFIERLAQTNRDLLTPKGWKGSIAEKAGVDRRDIEANLKLCEAMLSMTPRSVRRGGFMGDIVSLLSALVIFYSIYVFSVCLLHLTPGFWGHVTGTGATMGQAHCDYCAPRDAICHHFYQHVVPNPYFMYTARRIQAVLDYAETTRPYHHAKETYHGVTNSESYRVAKYHVYLARERVLNHPMVQTVAKEARQLGAAAVRQGRAMYAALHRHWTQTLLPHPATQKALATIDDLTAQGLALYHRHALPALHAFWQHPTVLRLQTSVVQLVHATQAYLQEGQQRLASMFAV